MGILKLKEEKLDKKALIIKEVLGYFSSKEQDFSKEEVEAIAAAADNAFSDEVLYEEFVNWVSEKDDESFLYLINHYWQSLGKPILGEADRDLTGKEKEIQKIKVNSKLEVAQKFASFLNKISNEKGLNTYDALGKFLGVSTERARVLLEGKHKPQRATISKVSEKFNIPFERILNEIQQ